MPTFSPLSIQSPHLQGYLQPEAMAIGDSIFNGVRSATISERLALGAPPRLVAGVFQWPMIVPDYRRPILFDLETEVREGISFSRLKSRILDNVDRWLEERGEWSNQRFFDNIGIAGASYRDMHKLTAGDCREKIPKLLSSIKNAPELDFSSIAKLWFNLNAAFLLNPSGQPELDDLTSLEQVASRKPRRLFINIGSNEGLFRIGLSCNYSRVYREKIAQIPNLAKDLAKKLDKYCGNVENIYFNHLVRPRTIANLAPRLDEDMFQITGEKYFERYVGRLGSINGMNGAQMSDLDVSVHAINLKAQEEMSDILDNRIHFIDCYELSTQYDGKHFGNSRKVRVMNGDTQWRLSNQPFSSGLFGFRHGGLFGLDNLHPSRVGYALVAQKMAEAVARTEKLEVSGIDLQEVFESDSLLQDPPRGWDLLNFLLGIMGSGEFLDEL